MAGTRNVFLGAQAGSLNSSGQANVFLGNSAGLNNTLGNNNTFIGTDAGFTNSSGFNNVFQGYRSGYFNQGGANNAFVGAGAGYANIQGADNVFVGSDAGSANVSGTDNVFIGSLSGVSNITAIGNTFLGSRTGQATTEGNYNLFMGFRAGFSNTTGGYNAFMGQNAGYSNTAGLGNLFMGSSSGYSNVKGNYNLFMGNSSGQNSSIGSGNVAIGDRAGYGLQTGSKNLYLGQYAGLTDNAGGNENVFIGFNTGVSPGVTVNNAIAIGSGAKVGVSNALVLGNGINVGIGLSAPTTRLEVSSGTAGQSGLKLTNLTSSSTPTQTTNQFLTVDNQGNVVLALVGTRKGTFRLGTTDSTATSSTWSLDGLHIRNINAGGVIIGPGVSSTPAGYRLYVADGILTEKVKVALQSTADWSDHVLAPGYALRPLRELAQFVQQNGHLPGVPSADEVVKQGLDVAKSDAMLLTKIEELTLYMIELKKENDALKRRQARTERKLSQLTSLRHAR